MILNIRRGRLKGRRIWATRVQKRRGEERNAEMKFISVRGRGYHKNAVVSGQLLFGQTLDAMASLSSVSVATGTSLLVARSQLWVLVGH